ncbi:hypothetical protein HK098_002329 [Nowakowskiella sp. JEL0407]|nr:hypothetical protein HK098_002329 [Nowakowskiella sp. JEL0407]
MDPKPRISSSQLQANRGKNVLLVGVVAQDMGQQLVLTTSDQGNVNVHLLPGESYPVGTVLEVTGKVNPDYTVQELAANVFDNDFDPKIYAKMVKITHQFPDVFGWE